MLLRLGFTDILALSGLNDLTTHQNRSYAIVHVVDHLIPDLRTLELKNHQGIFLLVRSVLNAMAQIIKLTKVLFPIIINDMQHHALLEFLHHILSLVVVSLLKVHSEIHHDTAICYRNQDELEPVTLRLIHLFNHRIGHRLDSVCLALEGPHGFLESALFEIGFDAIHKFVLAEWYLHRQDFKKLLLSPFKVVAFNDADHTVPNDIGNIHSDTLTHQGVTALLIDDGALLIHYIIIFKQMLTNTEVVLFHLLLCTLNAVRNHRVVEALTFLESQTVHHFGNTL